jgi:hypothetical protein
MSNHSDDQRKRWEERQRGLEQVREMLGAALVAHEMTDEQSYEALLAIAVEDAYAETEDTCGTA